MHLLTSPFSFFLFFGNVIFALKIDYSRLSSRIRKWDEELIRIQDCGQLEEIPGDLRTKSPWTAAVFLKQNSQYNFFITGTILSPTVILSIFGGPYGALPRGARGRYSLFPPENLLVGTGLLSGKLSNVDVHSQIAQVKYIIPYNRHNFRNTHYHLFLLHLKTPLNISTPYVRALCIHLDPRSYADKTPPDIAAFIERWPYNWIGFTSGFLATSSRKFQMLEGKSGSHEFCDSVFKYYYRNSSDSAHVFCAKYKYETQGFTDCWSFGSPMVVYIDILKRWMLSGLTALIPNRKKSTGKCKTSTWYFNANFVYGPETEWMIEQVASNSTGFACPLGKYVPLSSVCNGIWDCETGDDEEQIFCKATNRCNGHSEGYTHQCGYDGKCISPESLCDGKHDCVDGSDELSNKCLLSSPGSKVMFAEENFVKCPRIPISEGVAINCEDKSNVRVDCDAAVNGTKATLSCVQFYVSKLRFSSIKMICGERGQWEPFRTFGCEPECGVINSEDVNALIYDGKPITSELLFPWYAAIFRKSPSGDEMEFVCGGSLIESQAVVTAAHCLTQELESLSEFRIALGTKTIDFDLVLQSNVSQVFEVSRFWKPPSYDASDLKSDIALVRLNGSTTYGSDVRPVCYLTSSVLKIPEPGIIGKIAGFGIDETGLVSQVLKYAELPVISEEECQSAGSLEGTFCAGSLNKSTVCSGDSGGGLVFKLPKKTTKYELQGVVSHRKRGTSAHCNLDDYAIFTHVDTFNDWMNIILEEMDVENPEQNKLY